MKQFYTLGLAAAVSLGALAGVQLPTGSLKSRPLPVQRVAEARSARALKVQKTGAGVAFKTLPAAGRLNHKIAFRQALKARFAAGSAGVHEGFEGWDGEDMSWLPADWSRIATEGLPAAKTWSPNTSAGIGVTAADGTNIMVCEFNPEVALDEWLITPAVEVSAGMSLTYGEMALGLYCFSLDNVDWDLEDWVGDRVQIGDFQVMITEDDGANWTCLRSKAALSADKSYAELAYGEGYEFVNVQIPLGDYAGKTVKIAFRNTGKDTNLVAIDAVNIGFAPVALDMSSPSGQLSFGIADDMTTLGKSVSFNPAYTELAWFNNSSATDAEYSWLYADPVTGETAVSSDADLYRTYYPIYKTNFTQQGAPAVSNGVDNVYTAPVLRGSGANYMESTLKHHDYLAIGGKPQLFIPADPAQGINEDITVRFGVCPVDLARDGYTTVQDFWTGMPLLGYAPGVDKYWSEFTFGLAADENNWMHLSKLINIHPAPDAPMIIHGGWVPGLYQLTDSARLTMTVCPVSDEGEILFDNPLGSATVTGDKIAGLNPAEPTMGVAKFRFDKPVVVDNTLCSMYVVMLEGFRDSANVSYFCPIISDKADPQGMCFGWTYKDVCQEGQLNYSLATVANVTNKENGFYFMLDAEYAHLMADDSEISLNHGEAAEVVLDSYHAAADLQVFDAPAWLKVELAGQGDGARMTLTGTGEQGQTATFKVTGVGCERNFTVTMATGNSVGNVAVDGSTPLYYNLQGIRVARPVKGQTYIMRQGPAASKVVY